MPSATAATVKVPTGMHRLGRGVNPVQVRHGLRRTGDTGRAEREPDRAWHRSSRSDRGASRRAQIRFDGVPRMPSLPLRERTVTCTVAGQRQGPASSADADLRRGPYDSPGPRQEERVGRTIKPYERMVVARRVRRGPARGRRQVRTSSPTCPGTRGSASRRWRRSSAGTATSCATRSASTSSTPTPTTSTGIRGAVLHREGAGGADRGRGDRRRRGRRRRRPARRARHRGLPGPGAGRRPGARPRRRAARRDRRPVARCGSATAAIERTRRSVRARHVAQPLVPRRP